MLIFHHHIIDKLTPNKISRECNVSISTVNRIIVYFESWANKMSVLSSIRCKKTINYPAVQAWIKKYVEKEFGWFTSIDVRSYVKDQLFIIYFYFKIENLYIWLRIFDNLFYSYWLNLISFFLSFLPLLDHVELFRFEDVAILVVICDHIDDVFNWICVNLQGFWEIET